MRLSPRFLKIISIAPQLPENKWPLFTDPKKTLGPTYWPSVISKGFFNEGQIMSRVCMVSMYCNCFFFVTLCSHWAKKLLIQCCSDHVAMVAKADQNIYVKIISSIWKSIHPFHLCHLSFLKIFLITSSFWVFMIEQSVCITVWNVNQWENRFLATFKITI